MLSKAWTQTFRHHCLLPLHSWAALLPAETAWHSSKLAGSAWAVLQSSAQPRGILQVTSAPPQKQWDELKELF